MANNNSTGNNRSLWTLGFGILAGAALGYYLNTEKGRKVRSNVASEFNEYGNQISGIANEAGRLANNYAREARFQSEQLARNTKLKANELASNARQSINSGKDWIAKKTGSTAPNGTI